MLERRSTVLDDRKGKTRKVFSSAPARVTVELLSDCDTSYSVLMTPLPGFQQDDYLLEVTFEDGKAISFRNLYGETPSWADENTDWNSIESIFGARLLASHEMSY